MIADPKDSSVINAEDHAPILADLDSYGFLAGIPSFWIWQPLSDHAPAAVVRWATKFNAQTHGLLLVGPQVSKAEDVMAALTGCLIRNYVDARVRGREALLGDGTGSLTRGCTLLSIPDFCRSDDRLRMGVARGIEELLMERYRARKLTVLYARQLSLVRSMYGDAVADHVQEQYVEVSLA